MKHNTKAMSERNMTYSRKRIFPNLATNVGFTPSNFSSLTFSKQETKSTTTFSAITSHGLFISSSNQNPQTHY